MKKILSLLLGVLFAVTASVSLVACGETGGAEEEVTISISIPTGGQGDAWFIQARDDFYAALQAEGKEYVPGIKGCKIEYTRTEGNITGANSGYVMFLTSTSHKPVYEMVGQGYVLSMDELVRNPNRWNEDGSSIDSYIKPTFKNKSCVNVDGQDVYYGLPADEWWGGLMYDHQLFEQENLYFADKTAGQGTNVPVNNTRDLATDSKKCEIYLVNDADSKKSCGRDGVYGTADDGMPTTLRDLALLCLYMKNQKNINVFSLPGMHPYHLGYFYGALWAALSTPEEFLATSNWRGEVEYVLTDDTCKNVSYDSISVFQGILGAAEGDDYLKPMTDTIEITRDGIGTTLPYDAETNNYSKVGRYAFGTAARYYALAFMKFIYDYDLYDYETNSKSTVSHTDAQQIFIYSDETSQNGRRAFLIDGTYAYNEAKDCGHFANYEAEKGDTQHLRANNEIRWFALPATLDTEVEPNEDQSVSNEQVILTEQNTTWFLNKDFENTVQLEIAKDFLAFILSKKQLAKTTVLQNMTWGYNYSMEGYESQMTEFCKTIVNISKSAKVQNNSSDTQNICYYQSYADFSISCHSNRGIYYYPSTTGGPLYKKITAGTSMQTLFTDGLFTEGVWNSKTIYVPTT